MLAELLAVVLVGAIILLIFFLVKRIIYIVINSIIGVFALIGYNTLFGAGVAINFWSVIITAVGGIIGFIIVLALHYLGWAF